jgi:hypothetical protein
MANKKDTEQVIPMVDTVNQGILDYANKEDEEANKLFYEATGLTPPEEKSKEEDPKKEETPKGEETPKEEDPKKESEGEPLAKVVEEEGKKEDDLTIDLTVENADKRISAAQRKMHDSNKSAKDAVEAQDKLKKENDDLRALIDEKATEATNRDPEKTETIEVETQQTDAEIDDDLENLRKEYPEIAEPMIKMMQRQQAQNDVLQARLDKQEEKEDKRDADAKVSKENAHYNAIADVHKDFNEISQEPLLDEWIEGLPAIERAGAKVIRSGGSTEDVISLLTTFKKANGYELPGETKTQNGKSTDSKLDKARKHQTPQFNKGKEVNTDDKPILFTQAQMHKWTEKEWAANESAVNEAMSNGQVR